MIIWSTDNQCEWVRNVVAYSLPSHRHHFERKASLALLVRLLSCHAGMKLFQRAANRFLWILLFSRQDTELYKEVRTQKCRWRRLSIKVYKSFTNPSCPSIIHHCHLDGAGRRATGTGPGLAWMQHITKRLFSRVGLPLPSHLCSPPLLIRSVPYGLKWVIQKRSNQLCYNSLARHKAKKGANKQGQRSILFQHDNIQTWRLKGSIWDCSPFSSLQPPL